MALAIADGMFHDEAYTRPLRDREHAVDRPLELPLTEKRKATRRNCTVPPSVPG